MRGSFTVMYCSRARRWSKHSLSLVWVSSKACRLPSSDFSSNWISYWRTLGTRPWPARYCSMRLVFFCWCTTSSLRVESSWNSSWKLVLSFWKISYKDDYSTLGVCCINCSDLDNLICWNSFCTLSRNSWLNSVSPLVLYFFNYFFRS